MSFSVYCLTFRCETMVLLWYKLISRSTYQSGACFRFYSLSSSFEGKIAILKQKQNRKSLILSDWVRVRRACKNEQIRRDDDRSPGHAYSDVFQIFCCLIIFFFLGFFYFFFSSILFLTKIIGCVTQSSQLLIQRTHIYFFPFFVHAKMVRSCFYCCWCYNFIDFTFTACLHKCVWLFCLFLSLTFLSFTAIYGLCNFDILESLKNRWNAEFQWV